MDGSIGAGGAFRVARGARARVARVLVALGVIVGPASLARAEAPPGRPVVVVMAGERSAGAEAARSRLEAHARALGRTVASPEDAAREAGSTDRIDPSALDALEGAIAGLGRARAHAARLEDAEALAELARARTALDALLALPGASRWAAEVEVAIALVAHQAGAAALAERSMRAAATLDATRTIGSAEAPPALVGRFRAVAEEVAVGPRGTFVVSVSAPAARAWLDDAPLEPSSPRGAEGTAFAATASVGAHVLRVEAPGHRPYATRLDVFGGARPPVFVRLAPSPRALAADRALAAARRGDLGALAAELRASALPLEVWVALGGPEGDRSLFARCTAEGCSNADRLEDGRVSPAAVARAENGAVAPFGDRAILATSGDRERPREGTLRRRRGLLLGAAALVAAGAVAGAVVATRGDEASGLSATIDFGDLGGGSPLP